jgi:UDP-2,4-diacetamido-2,4,6-trideoxy-beta-L-altropyranose hydrolase
MPLSVCFRADAATWIGIGHVMRCLTLADALRERGHRCQFICRAHSGNLIAHIRSKGHAVIELPGTGEALPEPAAGTDQLDHAAWLGCDWSEDAAQALAALSENPVDWLVVDHYALDVRWESQLRAVCSRIMVLDDLADRAHDCDLLLDQTLGRRTSEYARWLSRPAELLCGSQYALLRPEFAEWRSKSLQRRDTGQIRHLLISMGGVDQHNATGQVLTVLNTADLPPNARVTVVMGARAPWLEQVRQQAGKMAIPVVVETDVRDMAGLMAVSDLAVGAAGATSWERCCLGLPAIMVVLAANQSGVAAGLKKAGAAEIIASSQQIEAGLPPLVESLLASPERCREMSERAARVTDGAGTARVTQYLEAMI